MSFDFAGYAFVLCANVCTCMNGVFTKKKLDAKVKSEDSCPTDCLHAVGGTSLLSFRIHFLLSVQLTVDCGIRM